jgi:predicted RNA binding protein YcfA (HicA-like mRNA interferase family)
MSRRDKLVAQVVDGSSDVAFRDFDAVARMFGFVLDRQTGSHRIYVHPRVTRPLNIQPIGKEVKRYQLRQFRAMVLEFQLHPDNA